MGIVYCREVAGLDDSLSSCMRQVEERYRVEERYYREVLQGGGAQAGGGAAHNLWAEVMEVDLNSLDRRWNRWVDIWTY